MALTIDGSDPSGDLGDLLDDKLAVATAVSDYLPIAGGKVLQVVRATDVTSRSTTSTSYVDASISVTITPQKNTSSILLLWSVRVNVSVGNTPSNLQITNAGNTAISGLEESQFFSASGAEMTVSTTLIAYDSPATISATTYKGRFKIIAGSGTLSVRNDLQTAQLFAIEVSA
jgi:hypothetical protein